MTTSSERPANRLAREASPYLQQHAQNPVDWYPWGEEALARARDEQKPIFLSIGYAACHWCHVMERESFENEAIASFLNEHFVSIKVDREERPDLDDIYMAAVQMMTGQGGWPMSIFLTPERKPFFGGTYFPPDDRYGRPGFPRLLEALKKAWDTRRDEVLESAEQMTASIQAMARVPEGNGFLTREPIEGAAAALARSFDSRWGGFGGAPKFPHSVSLELLLREYQRTGDLRQLAMVTTTLDRMAAGGMYDHLGGGFHRYSTDEQWLVPHFEKMLYDQALLVIAYVAAWQVTKNADYARVARETCEYVLRDLTHAEGGFFSSEDADSEGEEGLFYVWTPSELIALLGAGEAEILAAAYDVDEQGNFEGRSILHPIEWPLSALCATLAKRFGRTPEAIAESLRESRTRLLAARGLRERPFRDEKVVVAWNGLMIAALARAGRALSEPRFVEAAARAARFLWGAVQSDGALHRVWKDGQVAQPGYLEDYSHLAFGLVELYQADFDRGWLTQAEALVDRMLHEFGDPDGGFFSVSARHEGLITTLKSAQDGATPSGNSIAATVLFPLARLLDREDLESRAVTTLRAFQTHLERAPSAFQQMLLALDDYLGVRREIVIVGPREDAATRALIDATRATFLPRTVVTLRAVPARGEEAAPLPLHEGKEMVGGTPAAYVCENMTCGAPVSDPAALRDAITGSDRH
ncbi:MAG: thioredoxin domain-containing protein [Candidatus Eisenbacteria bacterium]